MPRASSSSITSRILCVLQCGRSRSGEPAMRIISVEVRFDQVAKDDQPGERISLVSAMT